MSKGLKLLSVIIPAYNEEGSLEELLGRIHSTLASLGQDYELVFIDDGSSDGTYGVVKEACEASGARAKLLQHYKKHGKSLALMHGFDVAEGDAAILMDADLQDIPEEIPKFIERYKDGYDCVVGHRRKRRDTLLKRMVSLVFNSLTAAMFRLRLHDVNCGFKILGREAYSSLDLRGDMHRLIPVIVNAFGMRVSEIPIDHAPRRHGKSRYGLLRYKGLIDIIAFIGMSTTQTRPFHVAIELSFVSFCLFVVSICAWQWVLGHWAIALLSAWLLFVATILPFFGIMLEIVSQAHQSREWRSRLLKRKDTFNCG